MTRTQGGHAVRKRPACNVGLINRGNVKRWIEQSDWSNSLTISTTRLSLLPGRRDDLVTGRTTLSVRRTWARDRLPEREVRQRDRSHVLYALLRPVRAVLHEGHRLTGTRRQHVPDDLLYHKSDLLIDETSTTQRALRTTFTGYVHLSGTRSLYASLISPARIGTCQQGVRLTSPECADQAGI